MRRGTFRDGTVDYAAVGVSQAQDLMSFPPERSIPAEQYWRIGSGQDRFSGAGDALMSWSAQRGANLHLQEVRPAAGPVYSGVGYDADGVPVAPSRTDVEPRYDADGTPYVSAGATVDLTGRAGRMRADGQYRVILSFEEPRRVGFVLGTVSGSVVSGEEYFLLEWRDNDEVWFTVRAFDRPNALIYRLFKPLVRRRRRELFTGYLRAISPLYKTSS